MLFHDGTKLDASVVKFNIERLMDPATRSSMRGVLRAGALPSRSDPSSVQIRLKYPYAFMLHMLAAYRMVHMFYLPTATQKYSLEDRKAGKPDAIPGCGPFRLVEWVKGSHLVMDRFDKYFEPGLPLPRPRRYQGDQGSRHADGRVQGRRDRLHRRLLRRSRRHAAGAESPRPDHDRQGNDADGGDDEGHRAGRRQADVEGARLPHAIFNDVRVRKAVGCYGIDRKEIVRIAFKGQATPWLGIIPPGTMDSVDVTHLCPYDPTRARALLAEAGYGPQKPLAFELMTSTEKSVFHVIATVIKEQMARIGADREHPCRRQGELDERRDAGWAVRHVHRGSRVPHDDRPELVPVGEHGRVEQRRATPTPRSTNTTRGTPGSWIRQAEGHRPRVPGVQRRQALLDTISGSPFYQVAQPWMKDYVYQAEFKVLYTKVWLDK